MAKFFAAKEFPSFMPIRATGAKVLNLVEAKLAVEKDEAKVEYLESIKARVEVNQESDFYFTIGQAQIVGIL